MGFSVSGAMVIILIGLFVAFGIAFPTMVGSVEEISGANDEQLDRVLNYQNGGINIIDISYQNTQQGLDVVIENTGTIGLTIEKIDVLVDGEYQTDVEREVISEGATEDASVLLPGEELELSMDGFVDDPEIVKIVTEFGHAVREEVE